MKGRPKVIFIASYSNNVFIGVNTWSWYIPIITSKFSLFFFKKIVSAANGPEILYFDFFSDFTTGMIIFSSSLNLPILSQCGFRPVNPIRGFFLKYLL